VHEVVTQSTGDCDAIRTRIPFEGVLPDGPASNDWRPGFMTELMAKDLDLAIGFAARANTPLFTSGVVRQLLGAAITAGYGREDFSSFGKIVRELGGV
jgi:3-hydroxyisobutyrate dehydrogenase